MPVALVVGAGIGGLASALALRQAGWDVRLFERAGQPRELGFGLALARNAVDALRELGAESVLPDAVVPTAAEVRHVDGRLIRRFTGESPRTAAEVTWPQMVLRQTLHRTLLRAVGPASVATGHQAVACSSDDRSAAVQFADGSTAAGDIVVGADGVQSAIRTALHPAEPPPQASGYVALRGASPAVAALNGLQAILYYGPGIECGVVQAAPDRIYWFLSLLADDLRGVGHDPAAVLRLWLPRFDDQFRVMAAATPADQLRLDELVTRPPLARWGRGRITLLGDAAHPMLPHTAQGAAQALEDAVGLGRALLHGGGDPIAALRRYEAVRSVRTAQIVRTGPRIARFSTTRTPWVIAARAALIRHIPASLAAQTFRRGRTDPNQALGPRLR